MPYRSLALLNILFNLLSTLFHLASVLSFIPVLTVLFKNVEPVAEKPAFAFSKEALQDILNYEMSHYIASHPNGEIRMLALICIVVATLFLFKNIFQYFARLTIGIMRTNAVRDIRKELYEKILALPLSFYSGEKKGDIISRMTNDVFDVEISIMQYLELLFRDPVVIILTLIIMLGISWPLTLISLVLFPLSALIIGRIGKTLKSTAVLGQEKQSDVLSNVEETLTGMRIIKAFGAEEKVGQKFDKENNSLARLLIKIIKRRDAASPLSEFLGATIMVTLVWFGGNMVLGEGATLTGELFIGYIAMFYQLLPPGKTITTAYYNVQKGTASAERILSILDTDNDIVEKPDAKELKQFEQGIEYRNVTFAYVDDPVLKNINLNVPKGKSVALVGSSGGGKSTMADLLPRFYDVQEGGIFIDDTNIKDLKVHDLRAQMGIVTQDSILFNDTVFNNISFGTENATEEDVIAAAKVANAHEFIMQMTEGYQQNIGDSGNKLSGGQKQRLSIARAVLKNPSILILDEATSALDSESEKLVQEALFKLMENRTSLVIAHRLSTIQHADEIVVMAQGEIVERGTHTELMALDGAYRSLQEMQGFD